jgi:hypothetical protein
MSTLVEPCGAEMDAVDATFPRNESLEQSPDSGYAGCTGRRGCRSRRSRGRWGSRGTRCGRSKEGLFDAVLADHVEDILGAVPLTANDLPGYAVRLYDAYLAHPRLVRLAAWARLERTPAGHLFGEASEAPKIQAIAQAQRDGHIDPALPPADVHSMVISLAMTWSPGSLTYTATATDHAADHERRRASLATAVRRAFATNVVQQVP